MVKEVNLRCTGNSFAWAQTPQWAASTSQNLLYASMLECKTKVPHGKPHKSHLAHNKLKADQNKLTAQDVLRGHYTPTMAQRTSTRSDKLPLIRSHTYIFGQKGCWHQTKLVTLHPKQQGTTLATNTSLPIVGLSSNNTTNEKT